MSECSLKKYKVAIWSLCYNHAPYLARTLDGFSMQNTNFKYLAVIVDDASTDGSQDVLNNYLDEFFVTTEKDTETKESAICFRRHKNNTNFYLVVLFLKYNFFQIKKSKIPIISEWTDLAEYWALCECDDFWNFDMKLQEEVDFLDKNPEYGLIYTDFNIFNYDSGEEVQAAFRNGAKPVIHSFEQHLIKAGYIAPMSWLCRYPLRELMSNYQAFQSIDLSFIIALEVFLRSKVYFMDKVTCVYGKHAGSATKQTTIAKQYEFAHGVYSTQKYYLDKYNLRNKHPECLDYFLNAYYCYIISHQKEEDYEELLSFFKRKGEKSIKFVLFDKMMRFKFTLPLLRALCRYRIKSQ